MKAWSTWLPDLMPQLPGCPIPLVEHKLRRVCQEFFSRTRAWQVVQDPLPVMSGIADVELAPDDARQGLVRVERAWLDGQRLTVTSAAELDNAYADDWLMHAGTPDRLVQITPGAAILYPAPVADALQGLKLRLSVMPSETATGIADDLFIAYKAPLASGALSHLMLQEDQPWSSPNLGAYHAGVFESAVNATKLAVARSFGAGRITSRPRFF